MRIGISSAQCGRLAQPAAVRATARAAEQLGYASVWVCDSLLDPAGVLSATAAATFRVRLGASLMLTAASDAVALARSLATVDVLSDGRLSIALGGGDGRLGTVLDVLDECWAEDGPARPVQQPRPPLFASGDLDLAARRADGWSPLNVPLDNLAAGWGKVRNLAAAHGRDPDRLHLVVRAGIDLTERPAGHGRSSYQGDAEQVAADVDAAWRIGAHEVVLGLRGDLTLDQALDGYARIAEAAELRSSYTS
jgi:alkanesulfonate monooxygenase SsuD/methylene tetrahydromethanopterin reductase-like flavin-dependent oxidoreductase (luciferase family)